MTLANDAKIGSLFAHNFQNPLFKVIFLGRLSSYLFLQVIPAEEKGFTIMSKSFAKLASVTANAGLCSYTRIPADARERFSRAVERLRPDLKELTLTLQSEIELLGKDVHGFYVGLVREKSVELDSVRIEAVDG